MSPDLLGVVKGLNRQEAAWLRQCRQTADVFSWAWDKLPEPTELDAVFLMLAVQERQGGRGDGLRSVVGLGKYWGRLARGRTNSIHINESRFQRLIRAKTPQDLYKALSVGLKVLAKEKMFLDQKELMAILQAFKRDQDRAPLRAPESWWFPLAEAFYCYQKGEPSFSEIEESTPRREIDMQRLSRQDPPEGVRPETLTPPVGWVPPSSDELLRMKALMEQAMGTRLSGSDMSRMAGVGGSRTWRDWVAGTKKIPYSVWGIYCEWAGFGCIWRDEKVDLSQMNV